MSHLNPMPGLGQRTLQLADHLPWTNTFGMSQEARKSQPDLSSPGGGGGGGDKTKSRMGFYKDSDLSDQSVFFNPSIFPPHRPDKDLGSQSLSQFGASLYGQQSKDFQMFHHDQGSIGMQNVPRGMPNPTQQFPGRTVTSHHGNIPGHVTPTSTGVPTMPSGLQQHAPSSPNRGILSVGPTIGPRSGLFNQMPSSNQGITIPNRGNAMPSGLASPNRQSPSILAMQQKQQQQQQRLGLGTIGSNPPTSIAGFNITRGASAFSNQNVISSASQAVLNNSFTSTVSDSAPTLDLNDFPALNNRGRRGSDGSGSNMPVNPITMSNMSTMASRTAYGSQEADWTRSMGVRESITPVGMVNKQADPPQEFQIQNEDFPALPGSNNANSLKASSLGNKFPTGLPLLLPNSAYDGTGLGNKDVSARYSGDKPNEQQKRGIQMHQDGKITNIPGGMVTDQFGMVGLLTFIKAAETDPNLVALALGSDLTTLGLNLNSPDSSIRSMKDSNFKNDLFLDLSRNLYSTFSSPWADTPCRPQDIDFHVPQEYLTNVHIRDKLAPIKLSRYGEDLLFYLYYTHGGDVLQLAAAAELYTRDWRYHKEERVWITRAPGMDPSVKTNSYERGTYYFFDCHGWRKVAKEFHLEYDKLEDRPHLPSSFHHTQSNTGTTPVMVH